MDRVVAYVRGQFNAPVPETEYPYILERVRREFVQKYLYEPERVCRYDYFVIAEGTGSLENLSLTCSNL